MDIMDDELHVCINDLCNLLQDIPSYDAVMKMEYLDMFVSEVLRLYAPSTRYMIHEETLCVSTTSVVLFCLFCFVCLLFVCLFLFSLLFVCFLFVCFCLVYCLFVFYFLSLNEDKTIQLKHGRDASDLNCKSNGHIQYNFNIGNMVFDNLTPKGFYLNSHEYFCLRHILR